MKSNIRFHIFRDCVERRKAVDTGIREKGPEGIRPVTTNTDRQTASRIARLVPVKRDDSEAESSSSVMPLNRVSNKTVSSSASPMCNNVSVRISPVMFLPYAP